MINLVQISDPHFGTLFSNTKEHWLHNSLNVHDFVLCQALDQFLSHDVLTLDGVSADEDLFLAMNGDLTAAGKKEQFEVANTFLFSEHAVVSDQRTQRVGLAYPQQSQDGKKDLYAGIPGNHDHGGGKWLYPLVKGFAPSVYQDFLDIPPYVRRFWNSEGIELCVFGIDSCSIFDEVSPNLNPLADGGFSGPHQKAFKELLHEELSKPLSNGCYLRTAVILCHHPFQEDGSAGPLYRDSALWLAKVAALFGIRLIFTGHTHRSWTETIRFTDFLGQPQQIREVRCPTTLQGPARLDERFRSPGLWLHQISANGDEVVWQGTLILFVAGKGFMACVTDDQSRPVERVGWYKENVPHLEPLQEDWINDVEAD